MSVYKRGDIWWFDFTVAGERYRGSTEQRRKDAALKIEDRERRRAALGELDRPVLTIEQAAARWFTARAAGRKSEKTTAQRLEIMLRLIGPNTLVSRIDAPEIEAAIQLRRLEPTRQSTKARVRLPSNATVNRDLVDSTLRPVLRYAKKALRQPVAEIEWKELRLEEPQERVRTFSAAELAAWRANLPEWHRPILDFLTRYGVRLREAFFHPDQVDAAAGRITLRPADRKGGVPHGIPLLPADARDIAARMGRAKAAKLPGADKPGLPTIWFREMRTGELRPIHWRAFQSASTKALKAAGIVDARPAHDFRHHAATAALRSPRGNLKVVQKLLGHRSIASTARYAHAEDDDVLEALRHVIGTTAEVAEQDASENNALPAKANGT